MLQSDRVGDDDVHPARPTGPHDGLELQNTLPFVEQLIGDKEFAQGALLIRSRLGE